MIFGSHGIKARQVRVVLQVRYFDGTSQRFVSQAKHIIEVRRPAVMGEREDRLDYLIRHTGILEGLRRVARVLDGVVQQRDARFGLRAHLVSQMEGVVHVRKT